jgi:hypothetical protein
MGTTPPNLDSHLRLLDIRYGDRSIMAFHADLVSSSSSAADPCRATRHNVFTSHALSPFAISTANWALFSRANCLRAQPLTAGALTLTAMADCAACNATGGQCRRGTMPGRTLLGVFALTATCNGDMR